MRVAWVIGQGALALSLVGSAACGSTSGQSPVAQGGTSAGAHSGAVAGAGGGAASSAGVGGNANGGGMSGASSGGVSGLAATKYQACAAYMNAQCNRRYLECSGFPTSDDPCPDFLAWCPDFLFSEGSRLDAAGVLSCAEKWRNHPCELLNKGFDPECGLPKGTRALGEPCYSGSQCSSGRCGAGDDSLHPSCGACIPIGEPGDTCADGKVACPNGYECTSAGCEAQITSNLPDGSPCERYGQCYGLSLCFPAPDGQMRCQPRRKAGEDCSNGAYCESGSICGASEVCEVQVPAKLGELCHLRGCEAGGWCNNAAAAPGTTRCIAVAGPGQACQTLMGLSGDIQGNCPEGMSCNCAGAGCTKTCVDLRRDGEACDSATSLCIAGTECQAGKCVGVELQGLAAAACED